MSIPQIQSIIQDVLQRAAKPGEAETWNALLQSTLTLDAIADAIVNSAEATTTVDPVIRMFQGVYGRVPDKAGLDYWVDVYRDLKATDNPNTPTVNEALVALARPFVDPVNTPEFATRYGTNPDGNAYVSALYFNVLGRPADQAGLQYWEGVYNAVLQQQIGKGLSASAAALETRAILLEQFISSAEFIASSDPFITQFLTGAAQQVDPAGLYTGSLMNDAPTDITVAGLTSVAENSNPVTAIATFTSVDKDFGQAATFSIVSDPSGYFEIVGNQLFVKAGAAVNFEAFATVPVTVKVTDAAGASYQEVVNVAITNVNEAPTQVGPGIAAVNENAVAGTVVTTLVTTDPDVGDTFTYAITTNPGGKFAISGNQIVVANGAVFDFESQSSYDIIVRSTDADGLTVFRQVTVSINDVNEAPSGVSLAGNAVAENSAAGTVVGTLSAQDPDGNPITYSISGGTGASLFEISGNQVVVKAGAVLNFEATNSYTLDISASDGSLSGPTGNFTISVTNVNEAPTAITGTLGPIAETAAVGANVGTVATTDQDAGQVFTYTIVGGTAASDFVIAPNGQVTVAPGANLVVTADEVRTLIIRSTDQGGLFTEQSFNVTVTNDVNAPGGNFSAVPGGQVTGTDNNDVFSGTDVTAQNATFNGGAGRDTVVLSLSNQILPPGPGLTNNIVVGMVGNSIEEVIATVNPSAPAPVPFSQVILSGFAAINKVSSVQSQQDLAFLDIQNSNVDLFITDVANGRTTTFDFDAQAVAGGSDAARLHMQEAGGTGGGNIGQTVVFTQNTIPGPQVANGGLETLTLFTSRAGTPTANDTVAIDNLNAGPSLTTLNIVTEVGGLTANLNIGDSGTATSLVTNNPNLSAIDASQHAGDIDIFIAGAGQDYDGSYRGGSSNDVVRIGDALADGVLGAFDGGAGFNTLVLNNEASLSQALTGAAGQFTNFNSVTWQNGFVETNNRLDTALVRGITTFDLRDTGSINASGVGTLQVERLLANTLHTFNIQKTNNADSLEIDLDVELDDADSPNGGASAAPQRGDGNADRAYFNLFSSGTYNVSMDEIEEFTFFTSGGTTQMNFVAGPDPVAANDLSSLFIRAAGGVGTVTTVTGTAPNLTSINATTGAPGTTSGSTTGSVDLDALVVSSAGANFLMGVGNDTVRGQGGNDTIDAGSGNDLVNAGGGADLVTAGEGADLVNGDAGNDTITGGNGNDTVNGGADNDVIDGGAGYDSLVGNAGNDTITGGDEDPAFGGDYILGDDASQGASGDDVINAGAGQDYVNGGAGNDVINGQADDDVLVGGAGNDTIAGGTGADTMTGGGDVGMGDDLDAAVASTSQYLVSGLIGAGDSFRYRIDGNNDGDFLDAVDFTSAFVTAAPGQTAGQIATQLAALGGGASGVTVSTSGDNVVFTKADGTAFRVETTAVDDLGTFDGTSPDTATITFAAGNYDVGDQITVDFDSPLVGGVTTVTLNVTTAGNQDVIAAAFAAAITAAAGDTNDIGVASVVGNVINLSGAFPGVDLTINNATVTNVAINQQTVTYAGSNGLAGATFTVGGINYFLAKAPGTEPVAHTGEAALIAAINAATAPGTVTDIRWDSSTAGDIQFVLSNLNGAGVAAAITNVVSQTPGESIDGVAAVAGIPVNANVAPTVNDGAPLPFHDNTQSFGGVETTSQAAVTNGVLAQTSGNDKFIINAGTTLATMDVITDFGQGNDTLSFEGATVAGNGTNTVNANLLSNGDLVGFVSLDAAILFANTVLNGNPQVEYLTAWVELGGGAGFQAGVDQVYVLSDVNTAGASDNLVSQVVGLQDFNATTISGSLITL